MTLPPIPKGICRDDTQHGKWYYTSAQLREYARAAIEALPKPKKAELPEFLRGFTGGKK